MNERQLQFRVGLFVLAAMVMVAVMVFQFGEFRELLSHRYQIQAHFESAPGVLEGSPVRLNGILIGSVTSIRLDEANGGVLLTLSIDENYRLRSDSVPSLQQSLLGDSLVEFTPGMSPVEFDRTTVLEGQPAFDVQSVVLRLDEQLRTTMTSFEATSREWQLVAHNVNSVVNTNRGNLQDVVARTAESLEEFTNTMRSAAQAFDHTNRLIGDPQTAENLQKALAGLPRLVQDTQQTIAAMRQTVTSINGNLKNIEGVTQPLAEHTTSIVVRLDRTLANLEFVTSELRDITELASRSDGSMKRFMSDPALYDNLERSTLSLSVLLRNLDPVVRDLRVFSDKVSRRPEILGVGGALRPSSGMSDDELRQAGFQQR